jgi:hypothetical protein
VQNPSHMFKLRTDDDAAAITDALVR